MATGNFGIDKKTKNQKHDCAPYAQKNSFNHNIFFDYSVVRNAYNIMDGWFDTKVMYNSVRVGLQDYRC